ncbi:MAG: hypothetical protein ACHQ5A_14180 [Opitutales bacterium]
MVTFSGRISTDGTNGARHKRHCPTVAFVFSQQSAAGVPTAKHAGLEPVSFVPFVLPRVSGDNCFWPFDPFTLPEETMSQEPPAGYRSRPGCTSPSPQPPASDSVCVRCGYSLRGLPTDGNCPECGLGIARSLALGQQLRESRPAWIASLAWAARLLLAAGALLLLTPFALQAWDLVAEMIDPGPYSRLRHQGEPLVVAGLFLLAAVAHLAGSWLLTRRENPHAAAEPSRGLHRALRLCSLAPMVAALLFLYAMGYEAHLRFLPRSWELRRFLEQLSGWIACLYAACPPMQFILLRRLAARVLNRRLLEHTRIAGIGFPAGVVLLILLPLLGDSLDPHNIAGFTAMLCICVFIGLFWLWSLYAFGMSARAFARAAREARDEWAKADASLDRE